ncbi:hypothetical protein LZ32DRAFT_695593 [Colletotrichum eremochloae]|nr:hypothetical protein LZ32DRAFT_695593 [Colletotrichum eremochloae]
MFALKPVDKRKRKSGWSCSHCGRPGNQVVGQKKAETGDWKGEHLVHQRLCQGCDENGRPLGLPVVCPACIKPIGTGRQEPTPKAWMNHWMRCQPELTLTDDFTLRNIHATFSKDLLPTTDLNGKFGNILSRKCPLWYDKELLQLQEKWNRDEVTAANGAANAMPQYRADFSKFFQGAIPVVYETHMSIVMPQLIVGVIRMILNHCSVSTSSIAYLNDNQIRKSNFAVIQGAYRANVGSLATHPFIATHADLSGPTPIILQKADIGHARDLTTLLSEYKEEEAIFGVVVEMVSSTTGEVLTSSEWDNISQACESLGLYLIVDENQTAIRCGAPFAHHLAAYKRFRPSFVLFGKGLKASGLAVYRDGVTVSQLGVTSESFQQTLLSFSQTTAEVFDPHLLLRAWAVVRVAARENWPQKAVAIGKNLCRILESIDPCRPPPLGCGALLFLGRAATAESRVTGASAGDSVVRWFPFLDAGMEDYNTVWSLFGVCSQSMREDLVKLVGGVCRDCVVCGDVALRGSWKRCDTCKGTICEDCLKGNMGMVPRHEAGTCLAPLDPETADGQRKRLRSS